MQIVICGGDSRQNALAFTGAWGGGLLAGEIPPDFFTLLRETFFSNSCLMRLLVQRGVRFRRGHAAKWRMLLHIKSDIVLLSDSCIDSNGHCGLQAQTSFKENENFEQNFDFLFQSSITKNHCIKNKQLMNQSSSVLFFTYERSVTPLSSDSLFWAVGHCGCKQGQQVRCEHTEYRYPKEEIKALGSAQFGKNQI